MRVNLIVGGIVATAIAVIIGLAVAMNSWACHSRWSDFEARYKLVGCQVKVNGKWMPEDRVRAFD